MARQVFGVPIFHTRTASTRAGQSFADRAGSAALARADGQSHVVAGRKLARVRAERRTATTPAEARHSSRAVGMSCKVDHRGLRTDGRQQAGGSTVPVRGSAAPAAGA